MSLVMKFGGTSVGTPRALRQAARLIQARLHEAPVVVLSALGGTTDSLIELGRAAASGATETRRRGAAELAERHWACARDLFHDDVPAALSAKIDEIVEELSSRLHDIARAGRLSDPDLDRLTGLGEQLSSRLLHALLVARGVPADWFAARDVLVTDARFGRARPDEPGIHERCDALLAPRVSAGRVIVTQGYVGSTPDGRHTTLGRGGSDLTAALLGAALGADEVQIWTDVEGVRTCDPRLVPGALALTELGFDEAAELAAFGARVLHPATIQPAVRASIPVTVRCAARPDGHFTTIRDGAVAADGVTALASRGPVTVMTVRTPRMFGSSGFLGRLFEVFGRLDVSVDLVSTAELSVSLTVEPDAPLAELVEAISPFARVEIARERCIVALIGGALRKTAGIGHRAFAALGDINVEMISMGANEINLSLVVRATDELNALRALHAEFLEGVPA